MLQIRSAVTLFFVATIMWLSPIKSATAEVAIGPECAGYKAEDQFFGTTICKIPYGSLGEQASQRVDPNLLRNYYGYAAFSSVQSFQSKAQSTASYIGGMIAGLVGYKDTYAAAISIVLGVDTNGTETTIATIPIANYSLTNGKLNASSQTFKIPAGRVGPLVALRNAKQIVVHFKVAVSQDSGLDKSLLFAAINTATEFAGLPGVVSPLISGAIGNVADLDSATRKKIVTGEYIETMGTGATDNAVLGFVAPTTDQLQTSFIGITVSLGHKQSYNQADGTTDYPSSPSPEPLAPQILLNKDTNVQSVIDGFGVPVKSLTSTPVKDSSGQSSDANKLARATMESVCASIDAAFVNPKYIELTSYDVQKLKYDYVLSKQPDEGFPVGGTPSCRTSEWATYQFVLKPEAGTNHVVSEAEATQPVHDFGNALAAPTVDDRKTGWQFLKTVDATDNAFHLYSYRSLFPEPPPGAISPFSCDNGPTNRCSSGWEELTTIRVCKVSEKPWKNGLPNAFGEIDVNKSGQIIDTPFVSFHALVEGAKQVYLVRAKLDPSNKKFSAISLMPSDPKKETMLVDDPLNPGKQKWAEADVHFLTADENAALAQGVKCQ